jgi:NADPH-dependent 2,4-dienoyl-CoA reductase/sulfur reductase-like enzyme
VVDDHGEVYSYEKLLLATGGFPRKLPFGGDRIIYFRTLNDYKQLREQTGQGRRFVVIGGGFIGSEIAAALRMNNEDVGIIFPEEGIAARIFPRDLSLFLNDYFRQKGVKVLAGESVIDIKDDGDGFALDIQNEQKLLADSVIAGIGLQPYTELAEKAGLKIGDGILVDEFLRASQLDIYAAGDGASFFNRLLNKWMRPEHEDNANTMGMLAGRNMAGESDVYQHLPFFYSDLFELGYEAVGELDPRLEIVSDWQEPYQKGVLYYLKDGRVRGVLLWNVWGQINAARKLIAARGPFREANLKGRLPDKK